MVAVDSLDGNVAKMLELKEKRKATLDEVNSDHAALTEANEIRMKENKAFQAEETDLLEAVAASKQAIVVLGGHHPELAQVRSAAQRLQLARVPQMLKTTGTLSMTS